MKVSSEAIRCNHCGNLFKMDCIGSCNDCKSERQEGGYEVEYGTFFDVYKCPACTKYIITKYFWHDLMDGSEDEVNVEQIFPPLSKEVRGLPLQIAKAYYVALKAKSIDPNSYAVMLGRVLELVCADKGAKGETLFQKISDLSNNNIIPDQLSEIAQHLRKLRNIGAHASLGELTQREIPVLDSLTLAIIEYIYTAPLLVNDAQDALNLINHNPKIT